MVHQASNSSNLPHAVACRAFVRDVVTRRSRISADDANDCWRTHVRHLWSRLYSIRNTATRLANGSLALEILTVGRGENRIWCEQATPIWPRLIGVRLRPHRQDISHAVLVGHVFCAFAYAA